MFVIIFRWITLATWLFWLFHYWGGLTGMRATFNKVSGPHQSRLDGIASAGIGVLTFALLGLALAICLGWEGITPWVADWPPALLGMLITLGGLVGAYYCRGRLGRFWTAEASLHPDHRVVDEGPYAVVRHPIYTATLFMYLGMALVYAHWLGGIIFILLVAAYMLKAMAEETLLTQHLAAYRQYQARVRYRLLPLLW